jgi:hypothetical protein
MSHAKAVRDLQKLDKHRFFVFLACKISAFQCVNVHTRVGCLAAFVLISKEFTKLLVF